MIKKWKQRKTKYTTYSQYVVGKLVVGETWYGGALRSKDDPDPRNYTAEIFLPGFKTAKTQHVSQEAANIRIERAFEIWQGWLNDDSGS